MDLSLRLVFSQTLSSFDFVWLGYHELAYTIAVLNPELPFTRANSLLPRSRSRQTVLLLIQFDDACVKSTALVRRWGLSGAGRTRADDSSGNLS